MPKQPLSLAKRRPRMPRRKRSPSTRRWRQEVPRRKREPSTRQQRLEHPAQVKQTLIQALRCNKSCLNRLSNEVFTGKGDRRGKFEKYSSYLSLLFSSH